MGKIKTNKVGVLKGHDVIDEEVSMARIIDENNNVYSGSKNINPGDLYITVNVTYQTYDQPQFRVNRITGVTDSEVELEVISPTLLVAGDRLTNSKLFCIIEEAKFLYNKYAVKNLG